MVFLVTKAYDTRWHAELIKPYLADDGFLIGVQNGVTAGVIADVVGPSRTKRCSSMPARSISSTTFSRRNS